MGQALGGGDVFREPADLGLDLAAELGHHRVITPQIDRVGGRRFQRTLGQHF